MKLACLIALAILPGMPAIAGAPLPDFVYYTTAGPENFPGREPPYNYVTLVNQSSEYHDTQTSGVGQSLTTVGVGMDSLNSGMSANATTFWSIPHYTPDGGFFFQGYEIYSLEVDGSPGQVTLNLGGTASVTSSNLTEADAAVVLSGKVGGSAVSNSLVSCESNLGTLEHSCTFSSMTVDVGVVYQVYVVVEGSTRTFNYPNLITDWSGGEASASVHPFFYLGDASHSLQFSSGAVNVDPSAVPELPAPMLMTLGMLVLGVACRGRRRQH